MSCLLTPVRLQMLQRGSLSGFAACHEAAEKLARLASNGLMTLPGRLDGSALHWQLIQGAAVSSEKVRSNTIMRDEDEQLARLTACGLMALLPGRLDDNSALHWQLIQGAAVISVQVLSDTSINCKTLILASERSCKAGPS